MTTVSNREYQTKDVFTIMHLNDLLDTILVTRKDEPHSAGQPASPGSGASTNTSETEFPTVKPPTMNDDASSPSSASSGDACPVDHKTRELWLQQARASGATSTTSPHQPAQAPPAPSQAAQQPSSSSWSPWSWFSSSPAPQPTSHPPPLQSPSASPQYNADGTLDTSRTISSIPRSSIPGGPAIHSSAPSSSSPSSPSTSCPSQPLNNESETGPHPSGNWIYPSELQFFEAMRRKGFTDTQVSDMKTVVPIHNAVNEKAWEQIKEWEAPYAGECSLGPRLYSFAGVKEKMTPRARMKTLLGYTAPFDRHDWIVDRCGKRVEYVIDFYAGRQEAGGEGKVNFYLDVRPKVNSWEGVKMRVLRGVGLA